MKNEIGQPSTPIPNQPTAGGVFKQAITNPSSGSAGNLFTPVGQMVPKRGSVPEAPGVDRVNNNRNKDTGNKDK
jgi:hypothetical protein